jgi:hypothetical protein
MISAAIWEFVVAVIGRVSGADGEDARRTRDSQPRTERRRRIVFAFALLVVSIVIFYVLVTRVE